MFRERKVEKKMTGIREQFPHYPFANLEELDVRIEARDYLRTRPIERIDGESEYVTRSTGLPDRRLTFSDQQLWKRLHSRTAQILNTPE